MNIMLLELKTTWKSVMKWNIALGGVVFMILAFFPSMQTESMKALAGAKMEGIDPQVLAALGLSELMDMSIITNFFGYVLQYITLAIMVFVTQHSVNLLIKEESEGTIEFLYSKPVSRSEIFLQKAITAVLSLLFLLVTLFVLTVIGYLSFSDMNFIGSIKEAGIFYGAIFYICLVYMAAGLLLSAILKTNKGSSGISVAIVFGTFLLGIIGITVSKLKFLSYLSPMDWIKTQKLMSDGIKMNEWLIGFSIIIVCFVIAFIQYQRKDLRV